MKDYYTTIGDNRGECYYRHKTIEVAKKCIENDKRKCKRRHIISDRYVVKVVDGEYIELNDDGAESLT